MGDDGYKTVLWLSDNVKTWAYAEVVRTNQYEGVSLKPHNDCTLNQSKDHLIDLQSKTMDNRFEMCIMNRYIPSADTGLKSVSSLARTARTPFIWLTFALAADVRRDSVP